MFRAIWKCQIIVANNFIIYFEENVKCIIMLINDTFIFNFFFYLSNLFHLMQFLFPPHEADLTLKKFTKILIIVTLYLNKYIYRRNFGLLYIEEIQWLVYFRKFIEYWLSLRSHYYFSILARRLTFISISQCKLCSD